LIKFRGQWVNVFNHKSNSAKEREGYMKTSGFMRGVFSIAFNTACTVLEEMRTQL
jgi:hypothetical protein